MNIGIVGGILGGLLGLAGGAVGTYASIRNTEGPRERRFMVRSAIAAWIGITLFCGIGSYGERCLSMGDYVTGMGPTRGAPGARGG